MPEMAGASGYAAVSRRHLESPESFFWFIAGLPVERIPWSIPMPARSTDICIAFLSARTVLGILTPAQTSLFAGRLTLDPIIVNVVILRVVRTIERNIRMWSYRMHIARGSTLDAYPCRLKTGAVI